LMALAYTIGSVVVGLLLERAYPRAVEERA
jgi:hypothetical protein